MLLLPALLLACAPSSSSDSGPDGGSDSGSDGDTPSWDSATWDLPEPEDLPAQPDPPDPFLSFFDGIEIDSPELWRDLRRRELLLLFGHYAYGHLPAVRATHTTVTATFEGALGGTADLDELDVEVGDDGVLHVLLVRPAGVTDAPVVLGINKCGNDSVLDEERVALHTGLAPDDCPEGRGGRASYWDLQGMIDAGYAVATVHDGDIATDDADRFPDALAGAVDPIDEAPWGAVSAWSWGLLHAAEGLRDSAHVDPADITVFGHSRRGKAALWAAAHDERLAVWAHQSGTLGATLSRSHNGESVAAILALFPHWFTPRLAGFADREDHLPFDQHLLIAMAAPNRVLVTDGEDDTWADPEGADQSVEQARPVFELLGADPDALQHRLRPGGHEVTAEDWALFRASRP